MRIGLIGIVLGLGLTGLWLGCDAPAECQGDNVSYTKCIVPTLTANCSGSGGCHGGDDPANGVQLEKVNEIYDSITNRKVVAGGKTYDMVKPGDPENSWLYIKMLINPPPPVGNSMPPNLRPPMSASQLEMFATWIREGAKNDDPNYKGGNNEVTPPTIPADVKDVSFSATIKPLLEAKCGTAGCHDSTTKSANVILAGDFIDTLMTQKSLNGSYDMIKAGAPEESLLSLKLLATRPTNAGSRMPPGGMDEKSIAQVWVWIKEGAKK